MKQLTINRARALGKDMNAKGYEHVRYLRWCPPFTERQLSGDDQ